MFIAKRLCALAHTTREADLFLVGHFCDGLFDLGSEHQEVFGKPCEKLLLRRIGRSSGDPVKLCCLISELNQLRLHVLHEAAYVGGLSSPLIQASAAFIGSSLSHMPQA